MIPLDARGLKCPMPVLTTNRALKNLAVGEVLEVVATDKKALKDMPDYCAEAGHTLLRVEEEEACCRFWIKKG